MDKMIELFNSNDRVRSYRLDEIGSFYGGLSGKSQKDFVDGNKKFITYKSVFLNPSVNLDICEKVHIDENEKQNKIEFGDILFTGSSETPDECGMTSVVTCEIDEDIYLNSFCFGYRFNNLIGLYPKYFSYLMRCQYIRKEISKTANGVTRYNISKKLLGRIKIPIPPLEIQYIIAEKLDELESITSLVTSLKEEISLRQKQYEYYREKLLTFDNKYIKTLGSVGVFTRGSGLQKSDFVDDGYPCIHYGQIHSSYNIFTTSTISFCTQETSSKLKKAKKGDLLIASTSEDIDNCCKAIAWLGDTEVAYSGDSYCFSHNEDPMYISYLFQSNMFSKQKKKYATGAKVVRISGDSMAKIELPIPPIGVQHSIVNKLNNLESIKTLIASLKDEIALRQKQYEYYREKLLTFD